MSTRLSSEICLFSRLICRGIAKFKSLDMWYQKPLYRHCLRGRSLLISWKDSRMKHSRNAWCASWSTKTANKSGQCPASTSFIPNASISGCSLEEELAPFASSTSKGTTTMFHNTRGMTKSEIEHCSQDS